MIYSIILITLLILNFPPPQQSPVYRLLSPFLGMHPGIKKNKSRYEWSLSFFYLDMLWALLPWLQIQTGKLNVLSIFSFCFPAASSLCVCVHLLFMFRQNLAVHSLSPFYLPRLNSWYGSSPAGSLLVDANAAPVSLQFLPPGRTLCSVTQVRTLSEGGRRGSPRGKPENKEWVGFREGGEKKINKRSDIWSRFVL